uniref:Uncharacterized protein n=1 Tax=Medicago truncatula TaxID=3880 RepID=A2Q537_MEDTR|nr:hypothetical protein MtrDRAFT_AC158501g30v2 [Medicago truncatula]
MESSLFDNGGFFYKATLVVGKRLYGNHYLRSALRSKGVIILNVAYSKITALLLPCGRTTC